jgi:hypothetical protein
MMKATIGMSLAKPKHRAMRCILPHYKWAMVFRCTSKICGMVHQWQSRGLEESY